MLREISDPNGYKLEFEYEEGKLTRLTDSGGMRYRLEYGPERLLLIIYRSSNSSSQEVKLRTYEFDPENRLTAVYDEYSNTVRYEYDPQNRIVKETNRNGYSFSYEYNAEGRCIKNQGPNGEYFREFEYFPSQHKTIVTYSQGQKTTYYWKETQ